MTCVVGIEGKDGEVWLGSDSFMGTDNLRDLTDKPKWFTKGAMTFGWAGDVRAAQVVEHVVLFRGRRRSEDPYRYLVGVVAKAIHIGLREAGANLRSQGVSDGTETSFLVVLAGRLYTLQGDYSMIRSRHGCAAIGMGADVALGALSALKKRVPPKECLEEALRCSALWCAQVSPPFYTSVFK